MSKVLFIVAMLLPACAICQTDETVYDRVEQMPHFPGGDDSMRHYLLYQLEYPEHSKNHHIEGRVDVRFLVDETGSLKNIVVQKGEVRDLNTEALRVVRSFPSFTPGMHNGRPVKVVVIVPIVFLLDDSYRKLQKKK